MLLKLKLDTERIPVLCRAPRLPIDRPFGPQLQEDDWSDLAAFVEDTINHLPVDPVERLSSLDRVYSRFVHAMVGQVSRATDTPPRQHHCRLQPPTIKWVTKEQRQKRQLKGWRCLQQPLGWLQAVFYQAHQAVTSFKPDVIDQLQDEIGEPPTEFHTHPGLMGLLTQARTILAAVAATDNPLSAEEQKGILDRFLEQIHQALEEEQQAQARSNQQQWRQWVQNSMGLHTGWAHKWSKLAAIWRPPNDELSLTNRPTDKLERGAARLSDIWGCTRHRAPKYRAPPEAISSLPPITVEEFKRTIGTFPKRTSCTWDGLHPRHFKLLTDTQVEVVLKMMHIIELAGEMPTCLQGIVATLIPKLKGEVEAFRSIGMMPCLYRVWARCRAPLAIP